MPETFQIYHKATYQAGQIVRAYPNNYDELRFDKNRMDARKTDAGDPFRVVQEV